jgi:iron complex outermembrane receptor protein
MDISKNCISPFCKLGLLVSAGLLCTTANAQSDDEAGANQTKSLDQITVTARKREERLQDIPTSAAALTRDFLGALNPVEDIRELTDLSKPRRHASSGKSPNIRRSTVAGNRPAVRAGGNCLREENPSAPDSLRVNNSKMGIYR